MTSRPSRRLRTLALLTLATAAAGCGPLQRTLRGYAEAPSSGLAGVQGSLSPDAPRWLHGQARFAFDDFGTLDTDRLETYGLPWKLAAAALVQRRHDVDGAPLTRKTLRTSLSSFGFVQPERILNWEGTFSGRVDGPLGLLSGQASRRLPRIELEVAGLGCAACHAGTMYDVRGHPTGDAWLGLPNSSIDVDAYGDSLIAALRAGVGNPERTLGTVRILFPDVEDAELGTLRKHVIPRARKQIVEMDAAREPPLPFTNGGPGVTNGVASTMHVLSVPIPEPGRVALTSIPYVGDRHLRSSLLADGLYAPRDTDRFAARNDRHPPSPEHLDGLAEIVALFVVPAMGGGVEMTREAIPAVGDVMRFLAVLEPPPFPGVIDSTLALAGEAVYSSRCAGCHGTTTGGLRNVRLADFPNRLVPVEVIGTDPARVQAARNAPLHLAKEIGFADHVDAEPTGGYIAPPLSGLWASAPYLHNGSVPTLWHLMNPELRPERFEVGGHALDYELVGISAVLDRKGVYRLPPDYRPWSTPAVYDTAEPGKGNEGHERPFVSLDSGQKRALLEYLKLL